ncbi:MAG: hypothetical protein ABL895_17435 [Cyclobacteriaceae bacterium]
MNFRYVFFLVCLMAVSEAFAQDTKPASKKVYTTTSGELIFSFANINYLGSESESVIRFSPVFNIQNWVNIDQSENFGIFTGFSVRNVGFIYDVPDQPGVRMKHRTYNLGIPIGFKLGNLSDKFIFAGYELEIPFNYKEKTFVNEDKTEKKDIWFSNRVNTFNHTLMAGVQLPYGATLKFKYYLTNFFNKDYEESDGQGGTSKPYANSDYNVFYFSLSFGLLKNSDFYYTNK